MPTLETLAAVEMLRAHSARAENSRDQRRRPDEVCSPPASIRTGLTDKDFDVLFTKDKPVIFAFHGYPWMIHRLTYRRTNHHNFHVRGYKEEGTTTTPFDMVVLNDLDRYHLVGDVIDRLPALRGRGLCQAGDPRQADRAPAVHSGPRGRPARDPQLAVGPGGFGPAAAEFHGSRQYLRPGGANRRFARRGCHRTGGKPCSSSPTEAIFDVRSMSAAGGEAKMACWQLSFNLTLRESSQEAISTFFGNQTTSDVQLFKSRQPLKLF